MLVLESARVRLEPLQSAHLADLCQVGLDPELWRLTTIRIETKEEMEAYIGKALAEEAEGTCVPFVIRLKETGAIIGSTRFHRLDLIHKRTEIGFTWLAPKCQKQGLNREAKHLMLEYAFRTLGCNRVEFRADEGNAPSRRALESLGATHEATFRAYIQSVHRGPRHVVVYSILKDEWPFLLPPQPSNLLGVSE